ncbi:phosphoribosyltransferase family protein [Amycolatopsis jejuensis]|uniref:phosphoribosyltransferase family protein n=1 Tax=Amycolatopsis jejuensis TaxID=330084 RepID=UPI000526D45F|nr:phosphoribosyltransferase family protein [Amycolatopsis jejuensis]
MRTVADRIREATVVLGDRTDYARYPDPAGWWRAPGLLRDLGPALAGLFDGDEPNVVLGPESRGSLLGPLVAVALGAGFVEVRKNRHPACDSDRWLQRTSPPDYQDRNLTLGFRRRLLSAGDRVLLVDDWIETGGQAFAAQALAADAGATWVGVAVIVDGLRRNEPRRQLRVRSLLHVRDL